MLRFLLTALALLVLQVYAFSQSIGVCPSTPNITVFAYNQLVYFPISINTYFSFDTIIDIPFYGSFTIINTPKSIVTTLIGTSTNVDYVTEFVTITTPESTAPTKTPLPPTTNIILEISPLGNQRRQQDISIGYISSEGLVANNCSNAQTFELVDATLRNRTSGLLVSANLRDLTTSLAGSNGSITTTFLDSSGIIVWENQAFSGGVASFYIQDTLETVIAVLSSSVDVTELIPVKLSVIQASACSQQAISSESISTSSATTSFLSLDTTSTQPTTAIATESSSSSTTSILAVPSLSSSINTPTISPLLSSTSSPTTTIVSSTLATLASTTQSTTRMESATITSLIATTTTISSSTSAISLPVPDCGLLAAGASCPSNQCCSTDGYCGQYNNLATDTFCGTGCQPTYGSCYVPPDCGPLAANAVCSGDQCCSADGYCGQYNNLATDAFCGTGCQPTYGSCYVPPDCGPLAANAVCSGDQCCSADGYCGQYNNLATDAFCGTGCQPTYGSCYVPPDCGPLAADASCPGNECCSADGYCGAYNALAADAFCGTGCQPTYGSCYVPPDCGPLAADASCPGNECCSADGYCGAYNALAADAFCGTGCQPTYGYCYVANDNIDQCPSAQGTDFTVPNASGGTDSYTMRCATRWFGTQGGDLYHSEVEDIHACAAMCSALSPINGCRYVVMDYAQIVNADSNCYLISYLDAPYGNDEDIGVTPQFDSANLVGAPLPSS